MNILSIDPSLTSLGYAHTAGETVVVGSIQPKGLKGLQRLEFLRSFVAQRLDDCNPVLVAYEGYAMGRFAGGGRLADLGELGGVLKMELFKRRIPILLIPPACLKLFATGKGNADKDKVRVAMAKLRGRLFANDDEADAYGLYRMGLAYSERRHRPRDPRHYMNTALGGCELVGDV